MYESRLQTLVSLFHHILITSMGKPNRIIQTDFSIEHPESYDNYMTLVFVKNNQVVATHTVRYPDWWRFYDNKYQYYIFSHN